VSKVRGTAKAGDIARPGGIAARVTLAHRPFETARRAFVEFLTIPTFVIGAFLLLAAATFMIDESQVSRPGWGFSDDQVMREFLGLIAASIITVTTMTFSLLILAVQQGATALTSLVLDQFLRRKANQFFIGFFVGLALYSLLMLASANDQHQPNFGSAVAGVMTAAALYMLIFLIYSSINQMRPVVILQSIHDLTLHARRCQRDLLRATRRAPRNSGQVVARITADGSGFMTRLDAHAIAQSVGGQDIEVVILASIGDYVALGDPIAEIRSARAVDEMKLEATIRDAVEVEDQRDIDCDPAFGIEQIVTIGWTSISSAKSNPDPGLLTIWNLRDLLARWLQSDSSFGTDSEHDSRPSSPVVYPDNLAGELLRGFESLSVAASESLQHQCAAEIYRTFATLLKRLSAPLQDFAGDIVMRSLAALGDHLLTSDLDEALAELADALGEAGQAKRAAAITRARRRMASNIGKLSSRTGRAKTGATHVK
jgi:prepilin signal peptidase PulO-like enzyme (type II secretory pathway)